MRGTLVNVIAIVVGSLIGMLFHKSIPDRVKTIAMQATGLTLILLGVDMGLATDNIIIVVLSLVLGGVIGEFINIEKKLNSFGEFVKKKVKSKNELFVEGFVTASIVYCVGAMAIVGSIEDGLNNNPLILYAKSLIDGILSLSFASAMGIGVMLSAIPIFLYQGGLTLLSGWAGGLLTTEVVNVVSATGGVLVIGIGINLLKIKKIKLANLLPALFVALILGLIFL